MALITGALFFAIRAFLALFQKVTLLFQIKKMAVFLSWLGALGYLLLSGISVSTERSFIMVALFCWQLY
jgi:competence protein ComEC